MYCQVSKPLTVHYRRNLMEHNEFHSIHTAIHMDKSVKLNAQNQFQWILVVQASYLKDQLVLKILAGPFLKKLIFLNFEQCGMGFGMFLWSKRPKLLNLTLIYKIMKICVKKLSTLSTGNLPASTTLLQKASGLEFHPVLPQNAFQRQCKDSNDPQATLLC